MEGSEDINRELSEENQGDKADFYGIIQNTLEVDSDVNEDRNRELQLDDAFMDWLKTNGHIKKEIKDAVHLDEES
jgi:hypothetical protein